MKNIKSIEEFKGNINEGSDIITENTKLEKDMNFFIHSFSIGFEKMLNTIIKDKKITDDRNIKYYFDVINTTEVDENDNIRKLLTISSIFNEIAKTYSIELNQYDYYKAQSVDFIARSK